MQKFKLVFAILVATLCYHSSSRAQDPVEGEHLNCEAGDRVSLTCSLNLEQAMVSDWVDDRTNDSKRDLLKDATLVIKGVANTGGSKEKATAEFQTTPTAFLSNPDQSKFVFSWTSHLKSISGDRGRHLVKSARDYECAFGQGDNGIMILLRNDDEGVVDGIIWSLMGFEQIPVTCK